MVRTVARVGALPKRVFLKDAEDTNISLIAFGRKTIYQMNRERTRSIPLTVDTCVLELIWMRKSKELTARLLLRVPFQSGKMFEVSIPIAMRTIQKIYQKYDQAIKLLGRQWQTHNRKNRGYVDLENPENELKFMKAAQEVLEEKERKRLLKEQGATNVS